MKAPPKEQADDPGLRWPDTFSAPGMPSRGGEIPFEYNANRHSPKRWKLAVVSAFQRFTLRRGPLIMTDRVAEHVAKDIAHIRTKADADAEAARDRAFATIAADPDKAAIYTEIRSYCASRRTDPAFPAELSKMVREDRDVAAALNVAPGFLAGISEERRAQLVQTAVVEFAPDDAAAMVHAVEVGREADKIEAGMRKLKIAAYDTAQSNKARETFVDPAAPFAEPPAAE